MSKRLTGINLQALSYGVGFTWEHYDPDENILEFNDFEVQLLESLFPPHSYLIIVETLEGRCVMIGNKTYDDFEYYTTFKRLEYHGLLDNISGKQYELSHPGRVIAKALCGV